MTYAELFAGVSGMGLGFDRAGMVCRWRVEWDRAAAGVLAHHSPDTPLFCDVVAFAAWLRRQRLNLHSKNYDDLISRFRTDIIGGGSPCQDLSVAGLRAGLDGERSGLFRVMVRICRIFRPRYVVWENVLGALSSNGGRDFAAVIGAWTGCVPEVPDGGWGAGGFARAAEPGRWNVAWRRFDSQYFGVPQRRRRVFLVASLGDGSCAEILFEPESVRGDHPPRRQSGERPAGTLSSRTEGGGGLGTDMELDGGIIAADVAPTLNAAFGEKQGLENQHIDSGGLFVATGGESAHQPDAQGQTLIQIREGGSFSGVPETTGPITAGIGKGPRGTEGIDSDWLVAHTLPTATSPSRLPIIPVGDLYKCPDCAHSWHQTEHSTKCPRCEADSAENMMIKPTIGPRRGQRFDFKTQSWVICSELVAFSSKDHGGDLAPTLRAGGHKDSHANAGIPPAVAFNWQAAGKQTSLGVGKDTAATLGRSTTQAVAINLRGRDGGAMPEASEVASVRAASGGSSRSYVQTAGVRRLTPRECERLQGWPDDHTRWARKLRLENNRWHIAGAAPVEQSDGPRYKQCGNGITANVAAWIGERIVKFSQ